MKLTPSQTRKLLAVARRAGITPAEAEECLQEALVVLARQPQAPASPGAFLADVVRKRAIDVKRKARTAGGDAPEPQAGPLDLDAVEEVLAIDGAIENLIMWGGTGSTRRIVKSIADFDRWPTLRWLAYCLAVIEALPRCDRQRRRLREQFEAGIRTALARSGYMLDAHRPRPAETITLGDLLGGRAGGEHDPVIEVDDDADGYPGDEHPGEADDEHRGGSILVTDPTLSRGITLALRFAPELGFRDALALAQAASDRVYGE